MVIYLNAGLDSDYINKHEEEDICMGLMFSYSYSSALNEYSIYFNGEIFCHLSESDFRVFVRICDKSGNRLLKNN